MVESSAGRDGAKRVKRDDEMVEKIRHDLSTLQHGLRFGRLATEAALDVPGNQAEQLFRLISAGIDELDGRLREARDGGNSH